MRLGSLELRRLWPGAERTSLRTVEVESPSAVDEAGWVFLAAGFIVLAMIYVYAFERYGVGGTNAVSAQRALLPYQILFRDLPDGEQRVFRAMQEGSTEAVRLRADKGSWPSVESLAGEGIPPFARDVLDKSGLRWSSTSEGLVTTYLGVPSAPEMSPAFLIRVQEPDPVTGEKAPAQGPQVVDEEHQLLRDGTLLHVTYWKGPARGLRAEAIADPALEGWQQIRVRTPFEEIEQQQ